AGEAGAAQAFGEQRLAAGVVGGDGGPRDQFAGKVEDFAHGPIVAAGRVSTRRWRYGLVEMLASARQDGGSRPALREAEGWRDETRPAGCRRMAGRDPPCETRQDGGSRPALRDAEALLEAVVAE